MKNRIYQHQATKVSCDMYSRDDTGMAWRPDCGRICDKTQSRTAVLCAAHCEFPFPRQAGALVLGTQQTEHDQVPKPQCCGCDHVPP